MRVRRRRGFSILEVTVSVAALGGLLIVAGVVLRSAGGLAQSAADEGTVSNRVQQSLVPVANEIRRASFATFQGLDGTAFSDGETDVGIRYRRVVGFNGAPVLAAPSVVRFVRPTGAATGEVLLDQGGVTMVLARQVTAFSVTRAGESFTVQVTARAGGADDTGRSQTGRMVVRARNP